jgi:hypothetical protein
VFATTRWSLVVAARGGSSPAREALAELCSLYWYPLYAYIRRRGHDHDETPVATTKKCSTTAATKAFMYGAASWSMLASGRREGW